MVLLSVITATHNGERFVDETIRSVLVQKGIDIDYVIVDDASTDGTRRIVDQYTNPKSPRHDSRVRKVFRDQHRGTIPTYWQGARLARGNFIKFLDHDDTLVGETALVEQARFLERYPQIAIVASATNFMDEDSAVYRTQRYPSNTGEIDKDKLRLNMLFHPRCLLVHGSMLIRREVLKEFEQFDQELVIDVLHSRYEIGYMDVPLFNYRNHRGNTSTDLKERMGNFARRMKNIDDLTEFDLAFLRVPLKTYRVLLEGLKVAYLYCTPKR